MKSKLFVLLVSLSVGSNSVAMEDLIYPSTWKAWYQAKRTTKPTQFILSCLSKSPNLKLDNEGLHWKPEISPMYYNGAEMRFRLQEGGSNSDPRIDDQYEDTITITTIFDQTNPALNKEEGFDYAFKRSFEKFNNYTKRDRYNKGDFKWLTQVDKSTRCGFKEMWGFVCKTKMPFQQFIDEIKNAEHKEQK